MKLEIINIINGQVMGEDSISFTSKAECEDYIKGMVAYVADRELEIEFDHKAFSTNDTRANGELISLFCAENFKSVATHHCLAWKDGSVTTICTLA